MMISLSELQVCKEEFDEVKKPEKNRSLACDLCDSQNARSEEHGLRQPFQELNDSESHKSQA